MTAQSQIFVTFLAHLAVLSTLLSAIGLVATQLLRSRHAQFRNTFVLSTFGSLALCPLVVAMFFWHISGTSAADSQIELQSHPKNDAIVAKSPRFLSSDYLFDGFLEGPIGARHLSADFNNRAKFAQWFGLGVCVIWAGGCVVTTARTRRSLVAWERIRDGLEMIDDTEIVSLGRDVARRVGLTSRFDMCISASVPWPFTVGVLRPIIVLPIQLVQQRDLELLEAIIGHEVGHIQRRDCLIASMIRSLSAGYWWNPCLRHLFTDFCRSREELCDDLVLRLKCDGKALATYLVSAAEQAAGAIPIVAIGVADSPAGLTRRVTQLLQRKVVPMSRCASLLSKLSVFIPLAFLIILASADFAYAQLKAGNAEFIPLGMLPGNNHSSAFGASPDGRFIVGRSGDDAFRWSQEEGMIDLDFAELSAVNGRPLAEDVSADGSIVVGGDGVANVFRWENGTVEVIGDLTSIGWPSDSPSGTRMSSGHGISADGSVVVGNTPGGNAGSDAFRIVSGQIEPIGDFPGGSNNTSARSVSADGSVVAGAAVSQRGTEAFRWEDGTFEPLGDLDGGDYISRAWQVSADGTTIVGRGTTELGVEAFVWTRESGMMGIGQLPGGSSDTVARAVSGDGSLVVGVANDDRPVAERIAFVWDEQNGMRNLQELLVNDYGLGDALSGWTLLQAAAISDDATTIAGAGINPDGLIEAYAVNVTQVPEPCSSVLALGAVIWLFGFWRRGGS